MGNQLPKAYTFEIENFSKRNDPFKSPLFSFQNCNWCVMVYPKGYCTSKHMSVYLGVPDSPLRSRHWSRNTTFRFVIVNPSSVLKSKSLELYYVFNKQYPLLGFKTALHLSKLHENNFLVNDKLTIEVYIHVTYVDGGLDPPLLPQPVNVNGFQVLHSQVKSANWIFKTYPETALYIHPQDPQLKTAYMNILLRIYETLYYSPLEKLTDAELINVSKGLLDLTHAGFKLEWLREKLENVSVERKKLNSYQAQAQELGKQLKDLEMMMSNLKSSFNN
ncbi:MATH domain and coiled-coil domain-containing protein [Cardamine amara subsp. amara]|uniref:MATH domain and coiled-coil domain-containing protein n=1 Tax=Cardamine amara subsp. amara TaxID=228776 RepID=A0ABD0ZA39_CARAN